MGYLKSSALLYDFGITEEGETMAVFAAAEEGPLSSRGKLVQAAIEQFSAKWYGTVSVAEICRVAGLSNGLFYRYFQSKEEIFKHILEFVINQIEQALSSIQGAGSRERLREFSRIIFEFSRDNPAMIRVFREGQYRFLEYERRLEEVYTEALARALGTGISQGGYIFALGGLRFAAIRSALQGVPVNLESLQRIIEHGLFDPSGVDAAKVFSTSIHPLPIDIMPNARERLFREGKTLFGQKGYFETNIHEITTAAGLSTGAFYTYFATKDAFYKELIERVGREVRRFISLNLDPSLNRVERELRGLWLFIVFLSLDRHCYRLVREAEFVLPAVVKGYYDAFVSGYRKYGDSYPGLDPDSAIEFMLGVAHYLGLETFLGKSLEKTKPLISEIGNYYKKGFDGKLD
jgi:AcrR family transcriptional regulator